MIATGSSEDNQKATGYKRYKNIMIMGGASDMLTGITGIYMGTFVGLPLAKKLYAILEPKIGRKNNQEVK